MLLLVTRLVIGELGHAMPIAAHAPVEQATAEMAGEPACAEHEGGGQETPKAHHSESGEAHDCCKSGECECPCLHAPCAALEAVAMTPVSTILLRIPHGTETVISQRPSGLFRPPA